MTPERLAEIRHWVEKFFDEGPPGGEVVELLAEVDRLQADNAYLLDQLNRGEAGA